MKWLKYFLILIALLFGIYVLNYYRLAVLPPKDLGHWDYIKNIEANTTHYYSQSPEELNGGVDSNGIWVQPQTTTIKTYVDLGSTMAVRLSTDPYMGTHYLSLWRELMPFSLKYPSGIVVYNQKLVALYYTTGNPKDSPETSHYHWHLHNNLCYMEGMVATTAHSMLWCLSHGYVWYPVNRYMLHVWLYPNPNGQNDLYNSNYP